MKITHDLHVHTYLSNCCVDKAGQTPRAILELAEKMGIATIGFADHVWANPEIAPSSWYLPQNKDQIARLRKDLSKISSKVRVLVGCESEIIAPGRYGITPEFARQLDFVLMPGGHFMMKGFVEQPESESPRDIGKHLLKFFSAGVKSGLATAIAHPFFPCGYEEHFDDAIASITDEEFTEAFGMAAERGVGVEITTGFLPPRPDGFTFSAETPLRFLSIAKRCGCKFTFGSDAHAPARQMRLPMLAMLVDAIGITENDLLPMLRQ
jgi:histidinol phosphatase-like PHP family hydrolase